MITEPPIFLSVSIANVFLQTHHRGGSLEIAVIPSYSIIWHKSIPRGILRGSQERFLRGLLKEFFRVFEKVSSLS